MLTQDITKRLKELERSIKRIVLNKCDSLPTVNVGKIVIFGNAFYFWNGIEYERMPTMTDLDDLGIGTNIYLANKYSDLPNPAFNVDKFYWVKNDEGTWWLPGGLGGNYYKKGLYYSDGVTWKDAPVPYEATQNEVNTGTEPYKFVTPKTLKNSTQWGAKVDKEAGKTLTSNDYTTIEKNKLSGIENNAQVNNISNSNATELTSGLTTNLHNHNNLYYTKTEIDNYIINGGLIF